MFVYTSLNVATRSSYRYAHTCHAFIQYVIHTFLLTRVIIIIIYCISFCRTRVLSRRVVLLVGRAVFVVKRGANGGGHLKIHFVYELLLQPHRIAIVFMSSEPKKYLGATFFFADTVRFRSSLVAANQRLGSPRRRSYHPQVAGGGGATRGVTHVRPRDFWCTSVSIFRSTESVKFGKKNNRGRVKRTEKL